MFCISMSPLPKDPGCQSATAERLEIELERAPELAAPGGALRLEGEGLPDRILVVHCTDGRFRAYRNHCACGGFRVDPVPGEEKIRCCTLMQSTYDYEGRRLSGSAKKDLDLLPLEQVEGTLKIDLTGVAGTPPSFARKG
jgi:nitrite reductase/ring-hydroxylating ferredoxin subunit